MRSSTILFVTFVMFAMSALSVDASKAMGGSWKKQMMKSMAKASTTNMTTYHDSSVYVAPCAWDTEGYECAPSEEILIHTLLSSKDEFANFLGHLGECVVSLDEKTCNLYPSCGWSSEDGECEFVDFVTGFEHSPCFQNAPSILTFITKSYDCSQIKSAKLCRKDTLCYWDEDDGCEADFLRIYTGYSIDDFFKVISIKSEETGTIFYSEFNITDPALDFQSILDWELPKTQCPKSVSEDVLCVFVDAFIEAIINEIFYCSLKYSEKNQLTKCDADPICVANPEGECDSRDSVTNGLKIFFEELASKSDGKGDKAVVTLWTDCGAANSESECPDQCEWDAEDGCEPKDNAIIEALIVEGSKNDGLCTFFELFASSHCDEFTDKAKCEKNATCSWDKSLKECDISGSHLIAVASEYDPELQEEIENLNLKCSNQTNEKTCNAASF